jgi:hypothetical protein
LARFEFKFEIVLFVLLFIFVSFRESSLLVSSCAAGRCGMVCSDEDPGRVGDLVQRTGMVAQVGYSVAGRSRGQVPPCAVCTMHVETRSAGFLVDPPNQGQQFMSGLASKPHGRFLAVWPQNLL